MDIEVKNAKIVGTYLGIKDHGVFTFTISLEYGRGGYQAFGNYFLSRYDESKKQIVGTAYGCTAIIRLLKVIGVESWEELKGKPCRARGDFSHIEAIGNYIEDEWLDMSKLAAAYSLQEA